MSVPDPSMKDDRGSEQVTLPPDPGGGTGPTEAAPLPPAGVALAPTLDGPSAADAGGPRPVVPGYDILGELGRGGMGVVYRARQVAADRVVALKMILAGGHAGAAELARFRTEAQAVARLQHPGIVQVFEVGEYEGLPFFSLEFVDGGSLDKKLRGTPLQPKQAARLVGQVAEAVGAAHQQHVVHRDLKPANILLTGDGRPKVTDFGLAKTLDVDHGHTATGAIMGTPSYMAPEQAGGRSKEIGPAADVYALGAVLYECLTGRPPFRAATPLDTILQALSGEPVPPRQLNAKVPRDLETVCLKCLHKEPSRRYASALALADDLKRFRKGEPIRARPVGRAERAVKWVRRRPALAGLLAALVLAALGLAGGGAWFTLQLDQARRRAEDNAATAEAARRDALNQLDRAEMSLYVNHIGRADRETEAHDLRLANQFLDQCRWDYRHWEWRHLRYRTHYTVPLHTARVAMAFVTGISFSPDGSRLACGGRGNSGGVVKVLDAHTGAEQLSLEMPPSTGSIGSVAFSPDGRRVAGGATEKVVTVWDAGTGAELLSLKGHTLPVTGVAYSPDGRRLASAAGDATKPNTPGEVTVWDAATGGELLTLRGQAGPVTGVAFSPDGKRLASASRDKTVKVWDARTGVEELALKGHNDSVTGVAFSPDGRRLASTNWGKGVQVWDARTGAGLFSLMGRSAFVRSVAFSPDGCRLAGAAGVVEVWDTRTGVEVCSLEGHTGPGGVAFSPDGRRLASGGAGKAVKVWDVATGVELLSLKGHTSAVTGVAFSADGSQLASASVDKTVKVWDARTGSELRTFRGHKFFVLCVALSADGRRLASAAGNHLTGEVKVWDARTGAELLSLKGHAGPVTGVAFSPDGRRLATATGDSSRPSFRGEVKVWDVDAGTELLTLRGHDGPVAAVAFSPDGRHLASASFDSSVRVWDAGTGAELLSLKGHTSAVTGVAYSPDGRRLASSSFDKTVRLWDARTGVELLSLKGHVLAVGGVGFSPDGRRLASAGGYGVGVDPNTDKPHELKVWDAGTGEEERPLKGHTMRVRSVAFSDDGSRVIARTFFALPGQPEVRAWDTTTGREVVPCTDPPPAVDAFTATHAGRQLRARAEGTTVYLRSTKDDNPDTRARRRREEEWTTIRWHLQQAGQAGTPFATRLHLHHALTELRALVFARLVDGDAPGCRHACMVLAAVAGRSDESIHQFQDVVSRRPNPAADDLLLALAYHKRGQAVEARRWLRRAVVSVERPGLRPVVGLLGAAGAGPLPALALVPDAIVRTATGPARHQWQSLRQEVEALLAGKP